jgi:hypothetical protein
VTVKILTEDREIGSTEAARILAISPVTLWRWGNQDLGPRFRVVGTTRKYLLSAVRAYRDSYRTGGGK